MQRPDFSGEWILNRPASTLSPGADGMKSGVWLIEHREPEVHVRASFVTASDPVQFEWALRTDAGEIVNVDENMTMASSLKWEGGGLVVRWRILRPEGETTITFRYELSEDRRRLTAVEQLRGTDHDQDNIWVFDRR
jgi:hypothetical protein